ncbi:MAG: tRNA (adenosine(37)-N6)-threonylcarbamoyltransferase complex ATPase subunit type 1 TsaE [Acidimicrobiia bacterium]
MFFRTDTGRSAKLQTLCRLNSSGAEETEALGEALSHHLREGDLVVLRGPLGSGKTTLVRGIARGLGCPAVSSPTFVLVMEYRGRKTLRHADFFRLESSVEVEDLGLEEIMGPEAITVVEWPEPLMPFAEAGYLQILLDFGCAPSERCIEVATEGEAFRSRSHRIAQALANTFQKAV